MRRQTSLLFLGLLAAGAGAQVAACSSDDSAAPPGGGSDAGGDVAQPTEDAGIFGCNGPLPVMTVRDGNGGQKAPNWSCYTGTNWYFRTFGTDDGGDDAATDASDAAVDATPPVDSGTDSGGNGQDSGPPPDAGPTDYRLHIVDLSSGLPPVGSTVEIFWGQSTLASVAFTGTVDDTGIVSFPPPPAGTAYLSYDLLASATEKPVYWQGQPIVPPGVTAANLGNGQAEGNSVSATTYNTLLVSVFGSESPGPNLATLSTTAIDCDGADVQGAQFTLVDGVTGVPIPTGTNAGDPRGFYFTNDIPNSRCTYTNNIAKGVWVMPNAPVNEPGSTHAYNLVMSGRMLSTDPPEGNTIDQASVELYANGITLALPRKLKGPPPNVPNPDGG